MLSWEGDWRFMRYAVLYQSKSGNTKLLAEEIFNSIDSDEKVICDIDECDEIPAVDVYFVGFGIHNYSCSIDIANCMENIGVSKLALFATCGYMPTEQYKEKLEDNLEVWLPETAEYLGMYLCQGKVEFDRREIMISKMPQAENKMREMFNQGCTHPDDEDLEAVSNFAKRVQRIVENN